MVLSPLRGVLHPNLSVLVHIFPTKKRKRIPRNTNLETGGYWKIPLQRGFNKPPEPAEPLVLLVFRWVLCDSTATPRQEDGSICPAAIKVGHGGRHKLGASVRE